MDKTTKELLEELWSLLPIITLDEMGVTVELSGIRNHIRDNDAAKDERIAELEKDFRFYKALSEKQTETIKENLEDVKEKDKQIKTLRKYIRDNCSMADFEIDELLFKKQRKGARNE